MVFLTIRVVLLVLLGMFLIALRTTLTSLPTLALLAVIATSLRLVLLLVLRALSLLRLLAALLLRSLVEGGAEVLQGAHQVNSQITLGLVGFLDRLGDSLDGAGEAFEGVVDGLEAGGDALEKLCVRIVRLIAGGSAHVCELGGFLELSCTEWAQEEG